MGARGDFLEVDMKQQPSFTNDFFELLFFSRRFFAQRFLEVPSRRIFALCHAGVFLGTVICNTLTLFFSYYLLLDFEREETPYFQLISSLGLDANSFTTLLKTQFAYSI